MFIPASFKAPFASLYVVIDPGPHGFPSPALRHFAPPVSVDGATAWWYNISQVGTPPGHQVPPGDHILLAEKDGYEVGFQAETSNQPESIASCLRSRAALTGTTELPASLKTFPRYGIRSRVALPRFAQ